MNGDQINKETSEALWAFISEAFEEWQKQGGRLDLDVDSELMEKVWVQWETTPPIHPDTKLKSLDCLMDMLVEEFSARYLRDEIGRASCRHSLQSSVGDDAVTKTHSGGARRA